MPMSSQEVPSNRNAIRKLSVEDIENSNLTKFGIGKWHPSWLQMFANPTAFTINLCIVNIFQLMASSVLFGTMGTLEKRFAFNSRVSSVIIIADGLFTALLSPFVGYIAIRFNRARLIAYGEIVLGLACLFIASPYFIYGPAKYMHLSNQTASSPESNYEMCAPHDYACSEQDSQNTVWPAVIILFVGNLVRGVGFTTYFTLALPFIDDIVPKKNSPFYIATMHAINLVGRLAGYYFCAYCLSLPEYPWADHTEEVIIGRWWLGFLVSGISVIIVSLPLLCYPSNFKSTNVKSEEIKKQLKDGEASLTKSLLRLIRNPLLLLFFLGNQFRYFGMDGFIVFLVKYLEAQYLLSSSRASSLAGTASYLPISIGLPIGGLFISLCKPRARLLFTLVFFAELVSIFSIGSGILLHCGKVKLQGVSPNNGTFFLESSCTQYCDCTTRMYSPICDPQTQTTYFSPCQAGCSSFNELNSTFEECSCFNGLAIKSYCESDLNCNNMPTYLTMLFIGSLISSTAITGNSLIAFRSVEPMDKSFTNGVLLSLGSLLAFMPSELFYGHLLDSSCLVWESKCGKQGNCWIYDQTKLRNTFLGVTVIFLMLGSLFDFIIIFYSDKIKDLYGDEL